MALKIIVSNNGTLQIQSFNVVFIDCEIVDPAALVAVAPAKDDDVDRGFPANRAAAIRPRPIAERRAVARFKLGQDERPEVLSDLLTGFGDSDLANWMRRFNADRT